MREDSFVLENEGIKGGSRCFEGRKKPNKGENGGVMEFQESSS